MPVLIVVVGVSTPCPAILTDLCKLLLLMCSPASGSRKSLLLTLNRQSSIIVTNHYRQPLSCIYQVLRNVLALVNLNQHWLARVRRIALHSKGPSIYLHCQLQGTELEKGCYLSSPSLPSYTDPYQQQKASRVQEYVPMSLSP